MGNFFNNGPKILKLIVRVRIYHILIYMQKINCGFEKLIFKNFLLKIYIVNLPGKYITGFVGQIGRKTYCSL